MMDSAPHLRGHRVLVVEDEYLVAAELGETLGEVGVIVVGPAGTVKAALEFVEADGAKLDGAVLDINLRGERVYPVAEALAARAIPFIFTSGYDGDGIPSEYGKVPRCEKP